MKCTDNQTRRRRAAAAARRRRRKRRRLIRRLLVVFLLLCCAAAGVHIYKTGHTKQTLVADYEAAHYNASVYRGELFSASVCVASEDVALDGAPNTSRMSAAGLFNESTYETAYAYNVHERAYPASLTKLMTALVAIKQADTDDVVTVTADADATTFAADEQTCGIREGDQLTLKDLLYGLLLYSGNDTAVAIADYVGGDTDTFADMMNEEAEAIMAFDSHFVNPNGLHDDNHYTTAYDLYLIFHECLKSELFQEIIASDSYTASVTGADGTKREITWEPTSYYALGDTPMPESGTIIGGKTGTTLKAGNCLMLYVQGDDGTPYISVIMGEATKETLYSDMTTLIEHIPSQGAQSSETDETDETG